MKKAPFCLWTIAALALVAPRFATILAAEVFLVPIRNASFTEGTDDRGIPTGWSRYGGGGKDQQLKVVDVAGAGKAVLIADGDPAAEVGIVQSFPLRGGETYRVTAKVRAVEGASTAGAYLQLRFLPSQEMVQTSLAARSATEFSPVSVKATAPPGTTQGVVYLYTHREPTPKVLVADLRVEGGLPPPPPPPPPPVPPQYSKLKDLHRDIALVRAGRPSAAIVAPAGIDPSAVLSIQQAIQRRTGATLPVVSDRSPEAAVPLQGNLIVLGNRSTNQTMSALYDRFFCLVDLKYPGPEGYVLRTVHNPFGNGHGAVIVGGSDAAGVAAGAFALADILAKTPSRDGNLSLGWTMVTRLGKGVTPPTDVRQFETWEASQGYGSVGYFGWTSISKHMAMYYMTGDERSAREVVRLAFPDAQALREIESIDGERIENKRDPLAGFYHYNAHMAILFWDLIEESPVFTDDERLKITNAFARQLNHRRGEGIYGLTRPPAGVGTRHDQWSAISLYCLGRYFQNGYPDPVWAQCVRAGELAFHSLHEHAWIAGENDNLYWYSTGIAPVLTYMTLTGDRKPLENGVLRELLRGLEILVSGRVPDWALHYAPLDLFHKAGYWTGDGRWIAYRQRTEMGTNVFRLGQSFWPDEAIQPQAPHDLVGQWSVHRLPPPAWEARASGIPAEESFYVASYRSAPDAGGDFILLDGFNGASRNPYHTFDLLELRLNGRTVLEGYHNQVLPSADGMVEPVVAMDAALRRCGVVGRTAFAIGEVPKAAYCNWRRMLCHRTGRYALVVDDLAFRTDSRNMKVRTTWQVPGGRWDPNQQAVRLPAASAATSVDFEIRSCDVQASTGSGVITMDWHGAVKQGDHRIAFYLIGQTSSKTPGALACSRLADNAAALALPRPALAVVGKCGMIQGTLVVLAVDHLCGLGLASAGVESPLVLSTEPVDLDWDFASGALHVAAAKPTSLRLALASVDQLHVDGAPAEVPGQGGNVTLALSAGRHAITGAIPNARMGGELIAHLARQTAAAREARAARPEASSGAAVAQREALPTAFSARLGGGVADMVAAPGDSGVALCVAQGAAIHVLGPDGKEMRRLQTDGNIRVLRWWDGPKLLLAGCVDEKVVAFDPAGQRRWTFVSEMDPAVYQAAKTYWFKSAPGHEGIHGLCTGEFDEGKSRCFVGSACTLEILDESGKLVRRTPVFWGPGRMFLLIPGPNHSKNLLISRWLNGNDDLSIVNSRTLAEVGRGFYGVPAGHSFVGGWSAQNRTALLHDDLDGDGKKEVATAINGTWNRVTVYSEDGKPLANAQFGPGTSTVPRAHMRDMDVADLDGDGKKELVVGIAEGLVVALNHECKKVWATRLPSPPYSLRCALPPAAKRPWIVVGCEDGGVAALDSRGELLRIGKLTGRPTHVQIVPEAGGLIAVFASDRGEVRGFRIGG